jgi:hypothetical protein
MAIFFESYRGDDIAGDDIAGYLNFGLFYNLFFLISLRESALQHNRKRINEATARFNHPLVIKLVQQS